VVTPHSTTDFTVDSAEAQFDLDHPNWREEVTQVPPEPIYPEKLRMKLTMRARDLEENNAGQPRLQWPKAEREQYSARIAAMGEAVTSQAVAGEMRIRGAVPGFTVGGLRFLDHLGTTRKGSMNPVQPLLENIGVPPLRIAGTGGASEFGSVEHDSTSFHADGDTIVGNFVQVKTIEHSNDTNIVQKITAALGQTLRDAEACLLLLPELSAADLQKFEAGTLACLPSTARPAWMCPTCSKLTLFSEDLAPGPPTPLSWADALSHAMAAQSCPGPRPHLAANLGIDSLQPATPAALGVLRTIMARYAGVSSLVPAKDEKEFLTKILKMLTRIEEQEVPRQLETALRLNPAQQAAIRSYAVMVCGWFGVGKTVVMLQIVMRALSDLVLFPNPAVFIVTWAESVELQSRLKTRFAGQHEVEVLSKEEFFVKFNITLDEKNRDQTVSAMCAELAGLQARDGRTCLLAIDELPPNTEKDKPDSCDWSGLDTHGIACVLCLQPTPDRRTATTISPPTPPASLDLVTLHRVIRSTLTITALLTWLLEQRSGYSHTAVPSGDIRPGHEVTGALPQVLLRKQQCPCEYSCQKPVPHHLTPLLPALLSLLTRLAATAGPAGVLVIMRTVEEAKGKDRDWLRGELAAVPGLAGVKVSSLPEARGTEHISMLFIGEERWAGLMEGTSRVTGQLSLCTWSLRKEPATTLSALLPRACREGKAEWAPEQDMLAPSPAAADSDSDCSSVASACCRMLQ
jgi:hypothetical protein